MSIKRPPQNCGEVFRDVLGQVIYGNPHDKFLNSDKAYGYVHEYIRSLVTKEASSFIGYYTEGVGDIDFENPKFPDKWSLAICVRKIENGDWVVTRIRDIKAGVWYMWQTSPSDPPF
jgi:hypothetical protein